MLERTNYMIGVDIGTTSTKAVLFKKNGEAVYKSDVGYPLHSPNVAVAEQDPEEIFQAVITTIKDCVAKAGDGTIHFISFSAAMHSVIAIDENDQALTKCITWADNRSAKWADLIRKYHNGHAIYRNTGTPIHSMSPLSKIMWLENDHPEIAMKTKKYIGIKAYIFFRLFGQYVVDHSIASATGMMNLEKLTWDEAALNVVQITEEKLPKLVKTTKKFHDVNSKYATEMGLDGKIPFIIGASDGVLSNVGVGAIEEGDVAVTIGTSGAVRTIIDQPKTDEKGRIFCYALTEKHWVIGGPVNNGGMILRWLKEALATSEVEVAESLDKNPYDMLTEIAADVPAGANGLLFHPFLAGERAPFWNPNMRGSFIGLSLTHEKKHMIRAVLEGVMFNLYSVLIALNEVMDTSIHTVKATGGFSRSPLWRQIMADIFDLEVSIPQSYESSCLGACVLGMYANGEIDDFSHVTSMIGTTYTHTPEVGTRKTYKELMAIFIRTSRILEKEYEQLSKLQR